MKKRLKIYTFPDKNPEYLQLQIDSFKKYMDDGNTDFIVVNTSNNNASEIASICFNNGIEVIEYTGSRPPFPHYVIEQYGWFRDNIQVNSKDYILLIHSDMFFINKLDYKKLMFDKKLYFNPQYRDTPFHVVIDGTFRYFYMWDGVVLFDSEYINENNLTQFFNWGFIDGITDVGGQTNKLLETIDMSVVEYFEMWTHHGFNKETNMLSSGLNGGINFTINLNDDIKKIYEGIQMGDKSFPYEKNVEDYESYVVEKIIKLKEIFIDPFDFENPVHSDCIQILGEPIEKSFIFHFKSGSMYKNKTHKLTQIQNIIFRDEI